MKFTNRLLVLLLAFIMAFSVTVMAAEPADPAQTPAEPAAISDDSVKVFETQDGVLSIVAPKDNDRWAVVQDDQRWFVMSDGTDSITVDHYSNGDTLPAAALAKDPIVQVYQVHYSTENEVFVVTGSVKIVEDMPYIRDSVNSFQVLKYDTKTADQPQPEATIGIREIESDMYCNTPDGVNVRESYSTASNIIGEIAYKEKVFVIGEVTKNGGDTGWLKIKYGSGEGYVYDEWFDINPPSDPERTGNEKTIYSYDGAQTRTIYFYTDGIWRDDNGNTYQGGMSAEVSCSDGTVWYESPMEPYRTGGELTLYREDGESTKEIYYYSDNQWRDDNDIVYYSIAEHMWQSEGIGQYFWYDDPSYIPGDDPYPVGGELTLYREDGGSVKEIYYYSDNQWRDDNGIVYYSFAEHMWQSEDGGQYFWYDDPDYIDPDYDDDDDYDYGEDEDYDYGEDEDYDQY